MENCDYCTKRKSKIEKYEADLEHERILECQKALEREKIAKGMQCTKEDEIALRAMQRMQMKEKRFIEVREAELDQMWHQVLIEDLKLKEEMEKRKLDRLHQEMQERRKAYDEQIASANKKRSEALQREREEENRRLEKMKIRMEQEYYDGIKKKKEQQDRNKLNYIESHEMKLSRLKKIRQEDRAIDQRTIDTALDELQKERCRKLLEVKSLQKEKQACIENMQRERKISEHLHIEAERIAQTWKEEMENASDFKLEALERDKRQRKEIRATDYREYLKERDRTIEKTKQERMVAMKNVELAALKEIELKLKNAKEEFNSQMEYRNSLNTQMRDNQRLLEDEFINMEIKQKPFTKKAIMFKDAMKDKMNESRTSTNPVHPFRKVMETNGRNNNFLPVL